MASASTSAVQSEVKALLTSTSTNGQTIVQNVHDALKNGFDTFLTSYGSDPTLKSSSKAVVLLDKIAKELRTLAAQHPLDYEFKDERNTYNLVVRGQINCRLKKLDKYGKPRPGKTERYKRFCDQSLSLNLEGGNKTKVNLFLGPTIDDFYTKLQNMFFSYPDHSDLKKINWRLEIKDLENNSQPSVFAVEIEELLPIITLKDNLKNGKEQKE